MRCGVILPGAAMAPLHLRHRGGAAGAGAGDFGWMPVKNPGLRAVGLKTRAAVKEGGKVGASFYDLLEISEGGSLEEIKRAYKKMARKYHPDVSPPDLASEYTRRFIELQEAYETLSDPGRRAMYDRDLARGLQFALSSRRRFDQVGLICCNFFFFGNLFDEMQCYAFVGESVMLVFGEIGTFLKRFLGSEFCG